MNQSSSGQKRAILAILACCLCCVLPAQGATPESATQRWSEKGRGGTPEFTRHVLPLIGKLGCNNRACHGSFQGQNGFRLSLFASDPAADRKVLLEGRIDLKNPEDSLALLKPTRTVSHKGGQRMQTGSWQYRLFLEWIKGGAPFDPHKDTRIEKLSIEPAEIVLRKGAAAVPLRLVARFSDGTTEDVTALTSFDSKDDGIAAVAGDGAVTTHRPGDTAIIASFGGEVASCQVLVPRPEGAPFPDFPPNNPIDILVRDKLRKLNIRPSELSTDEVFLRRVYLDLIGTLPPPEEVRQFLSDAHPDKRSRLIERLLARPEYAQYWGLIFSDITGNQGINPHPQVSYMWQTWLEDKLAKNWPYDEIVGGILKATSLEGRPREELIAEIELARKNFGARPSPGNGENDLSRWTRQFDQGVYAKRKTLDLYWLRIPNRSPDRVALQTSAAFLGIRLDCAQCHKHPFDRWTQQDFEQFQSFFRMVEYCHAPTGGPLPLGAIHYGREEVKVGLTQRNKVALQRYPPKLLGGKVVPCGEDAPDSRIALWEWMRAPDNPYFAPSLVNRVWSRYFGVGLVEPVEDFSNGNPPSNPRLLEWLARDFIEHGFDLKHLHRRILNSRTYQLSWEPNDSSRTDRRNYSHASFRRMPAEVLLHALANATGVPYRFSWTPEGSTPLNFAHTLGMPYPLELFGRGIRKQACGNCERSDEPSLNQALYLLTDADVLERTNVRQGRLAGLKSVADDRKVVEELYLCTLSRFPSQTEIAEAVKYRKECESRDVWMEDLLWSLLNVREFVFKR